MSIARWLDVFYPPSCALCGDSLRNGRYLCTPCRYSLPRIKKPFCVQCSAPIEGAVVEGTFSGDLMRKDQKVSGVTGPDGTVILSTTSWFRYVWGTGVHHFTFCVERVSASLPDNPDDDVMDCDTVYFL